AAYEKGLKSPRELARRAVALVLVLRERLHDDLLEVDRVPAHDRAGARGLTVLYLRHRVEVAIHAKEPLPRRQLPQDDAEREDICTAIDRLPGHLLGGHVGDLSLERTG